MYITSVCVVRLATNNEPTQELAFDNVLQKQTGPESDVRPCARMHPDEQNIMRQRQLCDERVVNSSITGMDKKLCMSMPLLAAAGAHSCAQSHNRGHECCLMKH